MIFYVGVFVVCICATAWAGWEQWTQEQRETVKEWIKTQGTGDTIKLQRRIVRRPQAGWVYSTNIVTRAQQLIALRQRIIRDISYYGIPTTNAVQILQNVDTSAVTNKVVVSQTPILGESFAQKHDLGEVLGGDVETAERDK
jgi:TRAP-type C4-dicarboxylate transport system permease small subunit